MAEFGSNDEFVSYARGTLSEPSDLLYVWHGRAVRTSAQVAVQVQQAAKTTLNALLTVALPGEAKLLILPERQCGVSAFDYHYQVMIPEEPALSIDSCDAAPWRCALQQQWVRDCNTACWVSVVLWLQDQ